MFRAVTCSSSGGQIVLLQKYSMTVESGLSPLSNVILYGHLPRVTIPEAVIIQFVLLKMSKVLLETC